MFVGDRDPFHAQLPLTVFGLFPLLELDALVAESIRRQLRPHLWCDENGAHCRFPPFLRILLKPWCLSLLSTVRLVSERHSSAKLGVSAQPMD